MKVAIVIPAHDEGKTIAAVVRSVLPHGRPIVVDDCSTDATGSLAAAAGADVVRHPANRGYDAALQSGFERAAALGADVAITFDADGQHDAAVLHQFVAPLCGGEVDLVLGVREQFPRFAEAAFGRYTRVRYGVPDILCGLKGYRMELYRRHGRFDGSRSIGTELALASLATGARVKLATVPIHPRADQPRFGSRVRANLRVFRAMLVAMRTDLSRSRRTQ